MWHMGSKSDTLGTAVSEPQEPNFWNKCTCQIRPCGPVGARLNLTHRDRPNRIDSGFQRQQEAYFEARTYLQGKGTLANLPAVLMAKHCDLPGQLDLWEKGMAAGSAAVISTLVANPLELVKVSNDARTGQAGSPAKVRDAGRKLHEVYERV